MKMNKILMSFGLLAISMSPIHAFALDKENYLRLSKATIEEANSGFVTNINQLIAIQEKLVALGVEGSKNYIKRHPEHADLLGEVIANADKMKKMTLEEIEDQWHSGKHMRAAGFDLDKLDHFGELFSLIDTIIHPATSFIALNDYKRTRNADLLSRASAELIEVVEHVEHIKPETGTQLTEN